MVQPQGSSSKGLGTVQRVATKIGAHSPEVTWQRLEVFTSFPMFPPIRELTSVIMHQSSSKSAFKNFVLIVILSDFIPS